MAPTLALLLVGMLQAAPPPALKEGSEVRFILSNGKTVSSYKLAGCGDERMVDLCLVKVDGWIHGGRA